MKSQGAIKKAKTRENRLMLGLCTECGMEALEGSIYCGYHDELKDELLEKLEARKSYGCSRCGKPPEPGRSMCAKHLKHHRDWKREYMKFKKGGKNA